MNVYGKDAGPVLDENVKFYFAGVMQEYKSASEQELQDASYFFISYVDKCGCSDNMMIYEITSQLIEIAMWADSSKIDVLQNAVYGIGTMAKHLNKEAFKSLLAKSMEAIERVTSLPEAQDEEHLIVTENAYISLGVLAMFQTHEPAHVQKFLQLLPL